MHCIISIGLLGRPGTFNQIHVAGLRRFINLKKLSGVVVSTLDFCAGDPGSIPAGAEFPTGIFSR